MECTLKNMIYIFYKLNVRFRLQKETETKDDNVSNVVLECVSSFSEIVSRSRIYFISNSFFEAKENWKRNKSTFEIMSLEWAAFEDWTETYGSIFSWIFSILFGVRSRVAKWFRICVQFQKNTNKQKKYGRGFTLVKRICVFNPFSVSSVCQFLSLLPELYSASKTWTLFALSFQSRANDRQVYQVWRRCAHTFLLQIITIFVEIWEERQGEAERKREKFDEIEWELNEVNVHNDCSNYFSCTQSKTGASEGEKEQQTFFPNEEQALLEIEALNKHG